jgi:hypothetical protein
VVLGGREKASKPCSVVTIMVSPTMIGAAELVSSSPVASELTCFPSRKAKTTAMELESGVNSAASCIVNGCDEIRPGKSFFQIIFPFSLSK